MTESQTPSLNIKCPNCGSPEVAFSAKTQSLYCEYCGYNKPLPKGQDGIIERPLSESYSEDNIPRGLAIQSTTFHCNSCGADTSVPKDLPTFSCPFCGSENVNEAAVSQRVIQPAGVLPFTVPKEEVAGKFKKWLGRGWFHPGNLKKFAKIDNIKGVYIPFWTFDAFTQSQWRADAGFYYYVQERFRDANGNTQVRTVRKVRWQPARGYHEQFFDDVLVSASHGVEQQMVERIYPFALEEVVNYDSRYLLGWEAEIYQRDLRQGYDTADSIMDQHIRAACIRQIPGDTYRFLKINTEKNQHTFKHLLLPVWVAGYRYKNKVFQFLVNGQTGKIAGKKPLSFWRIALVVLLVAAAVGGLILLRETGIINV
ncbi:MAG: TFIIB-type zinc ribbon-containing protein [Bacteroidota bacterium]